MTWHGLATFSSLSAMPTVRRCGDRLMSYTYRRIAEQMEVAPSTA